jgi:drug/metabolite transporter (DMT)-like permease
MTAEAVAIPHQARPLKGILLVVFATLAFALTDVMTKDLMTRHPVAVVIAMRYLVNAGLLAVLLYPRLGPRLWRVRRRGLVLFRGLCLTLASLTMGLALRVMPVGETVAIVYLSPFAVMLLAVPLLGERVGAIGWACAVAGFAGVLLILRPGSGLDPRGVTFALINACLATAYHLLTRFLAGSETTIALLFQTALVGSVCFGLGAMGSLGGLHIGAADFGAMVLLGGFATLGHLLFTRAYREAPASLLAPVNYLHLVWAAGLGVLIFGHVPDALSLAGMALVCASGIGIALRAGRASTPM